MELKGHLLYYPEGKHDINLDNYVQKSQLNDAIKSKVDSITKTTYADLKSLRDNSQLVPGSLYRITDYNCTTTQENTQSAGHQFDIVLLALSENKLAEEGWAMEHPTDVYDVTYDDGESENLQTAKCYIYDNGNAYNIVDVQTLLGCSNLSYEDIEFGSDKTANIPNATVNLTRPDIPYNYFQNSNLSAWKVWYCLDNDKSRFAWADDSLDESTEESITTRVQGGGGAPAVNYNCIRDTSKDRTYQGQDYYCWVHDSSSFTFYTKTENISIGEDTYTITGGGMSASSYGVITAYTPAHEGTGLPNGRGVIYRLIDEWNNDCPYDFKNIQLYLPIVDGEYVEDGQKIWVYTFCLYNSDEGTYEDGSLKIIEVSVDDTYIVFNNIFMTANFNARNCNSIVFNVAIGYYSLSDEDGFAPHNCIYDNCSFATIRGSSARLYDCRVRDFVALRGGIYYDTKKVLTES